MIGAQSLVAIRYSNGSVSAHTSPISSTTTQLAAAPLSFNVPKISALFTNGEMTIFATLELPSGRTNFNQVWQIGPLSGATPSVHSLNSENTNSAGTVDFSSGQTSSGGGVGVLRRRRKNVSDSIS